jgi:lipoprotein-releasing system permease protein
LILIIACCNILSLLVILLNDKKGEIGALLAMGATPRSLSLLFGTCGAIMGAAGCILGTLLSIATLSQMDAIVAFLSKIQGHNPFNPAFYGDSLPSTLSTSALYFVAIVTPIVSFIAGIIPAMRMCRIHTASILRSE